MSQTIILIFKKKKKKLLQSDGTIQGSDWNIKTSKFVEKDKQNRAKYFSVTKRERERESLISRSATRSQRNKLAPTPRFLESTQIKYFLV
jgi:hypothetical protein